MIDVSLHIELEEEDALMLSEQLDKTAAFVVSTGLKDDDLVVVKMRELRDIIDNKFREFGIEGGYHLFGRRGGKND